MPFPTAFPAEAALNLAGYLRGGSERPLASLVEDAYDLLGYGLSLALPSETPKLMRGKPPSKAAAASKLEELANEAKDDGTRAVGEPLVGALPGWLVPFAMELLGKLLAAWQKG